MKNYNISAAIITLVVVLPCLAACKRSVSLKQDTPQAAVATLVKIYEAKQFDSLKELVDPLFLAAEARRLACMDVILVNSGCIDALNRCFESGGVKYGCKLPDHCANTSKVTDCTCGEVGGAAKLRPFTEMDYHHGLAALELTAETCTIRNAYPGREAIKWAFEQNYCRASAPEEEYATVVLLCGDTAEKTLVLRKKEDKWRLVGFEPVTSSALAVAGQVVRANDAGEERRRELNKDLK